MDIVIMMGLFGLLSGVSLMAAAFHISNRVRSRAIDKRFERVFDELYPFVRMESVEKVEQMETTIKNEEIAV